MTKIIKVEELSNPIRLDKYLKKKIKDISREKIIYCIKKGKIKIEGKNKIKPSFILKGKEKILLEISDFLGSTKELSSIKPQSIFPEPKILYEDKDLLIINKPAGIIVHPTLNNIDNPSIASWFLQKYSFVSNVDDSSTDSGQENLRPGIVHRLDKETSGVLILAKNNLILNYFKNLFKARKVKKEYIALVKGEIKKRQGIIDLSLIRSKKSPIKRKIVIKKDRGKIALTKYKVLKPYEGYTLLEIFPQTGRTHQIRVHLASIGFPVVGDKMYGKSKKLNKLNLSRHFLHAQTISFILPSGKSIKIQAPLPEDLKKILQQLKPKID
jgi:23S rRNA pseudouridine1911/1915/1917 synthase